MILSLGYFLLCITLILGIATISSIYLERKSLLTLADSAAHYAANQLDVTQYYLYLDAPENKLVITQADIDRSLQQFQLSASHLTSEFAELSLIGEVLPGRDNGVQIHATAQIQPTFVAWLLESLNTAITVQVSTHALPIDA